jgi:hypothetical protein
MTNPTLVREELQAPDTPHQFLKVRSIDWLIVGDLINKTKDTIRINLTGMRTLGKIQKEKFADNQVISIHRLEDWTFIVLYYIGDLYADLNKETIIPNNLVSGIVASPSHIQCDRLQAISALLAPDKLMKVYYTLEYLREYFNISLYQLTSNVWSTGQKVDINLSAP